MSVKFHKNVFSDRSSLVLRAMLRNPEKTWSVRDFLGEGISVGQANKTLNRMEHHGYISRERCGRNSFSRLIQKEKLIRDWITAYSLDMNHWGWYHDPGRDFLKRFSSFMERQKIKYALTGFSASRLISPYVLDNRHFVYIDASPEKYLEILEDLQNQLGLLKLVHGGNVWISIPYYQSSVFKEVQMAGKYPIVSHLQLLLDLMQLPAGNEEIEHLKKFFAKKRKSFV